LGLFVVITLNVNWLKPLRHIAICGNIGSGKTTLAEKLARHYGWTALYEAVDKNPYLRDFYHDMPRWAFHLQFYFLNSRFQQINQIQTSEKITVQDRTIYEDAYIFAANLHKSGYINERDYQSYLDIFNSMRGFVQPPDLLVYLKADTPKLVKQIEKRGRDYEYAMSLDYLKKLNAHYENWIAQYNHGKLLVIDVNNLDFGERVEDFAFIIGKVDLELHNLFPS
jgi:deoxyadenosine/deoxycytidine kinase